MANVAPVLPTHRNSLPEPAAIAESACVERRDYRIQKSISSVTRTSTGWPLRRPGSNRH
jgi:hypothetical protein